MADARDVSATDFARSFAFYSKEAIAKRLSASPTMAA